MGTVQTFTTFDEFLNLPDPPSGHLELHHGQVILVPPRKHRHAEIQQALLELLLPLTHGKGLLTIEFPFRAPGHEAWQADVGFVCEDRRAGITDYLMGAPDLVIEVLSPSNPVDEINDKIFVWRMAVSSFGPLTKSGDSCPLLKAMSQGSIGNRRQSLCRNRSKARFP